MIANRNKNKQDDHNAMLDSNRLVIKNNDISKFYHTLTPYPNPTLSSHSSLTYHTLPSWTKKKSGWNDPPNLAEMTQGRNNPGLNRYHDLPKRTGPKRTYENTKTDFYEYRNRLLWVPKLLGTDISSDRNELQWEPEKVGWGTIGTILIKLCMYWYGGVM